MNNQILGIGGFFIKTKNPKALNEWYVKHMGWVTDGYGFSFQSAENVKPIFQVLSFFSEDSNYFAPSKAMAMLNIRVKDIYACEAYCKAQNIEIVDAIECFEYGKFLHIMDPDGNKIEFWEPNDVEYNSMVGEHKNIQQ